MLSTLLSNYHEWLKVADDALPKNVFGYLVQLCLGPFRADPFTLLPYDDPKELAKCGGIGTETFLPKDLPETERPRPEISKWIAPNRQVSQLTGEEMHVLLEKAIQEIITKHTSKIHISKSLLEKTSDALFVSDSINPIHAIAQKQKREIAHVHTGASGGDYSLHLCLSPAGCKEVREGLGGEDDARGQLCSSGVSDCVYSQD